MVSALTLLPALAACVAAQCSTETDEAATLLVSKTTQHVSSVREETFTYDPAKDFVASWEETAAFEYAVMFAQAAAVALLEQIPVIGQICSLVLSVFFLGRGKDFSWAQPLVEMIQEWTKKYASDEVFQEVKATAMAKLSGGRTELNKYEHGMEAVKKNASAGLPLDTIYFSNLYGLTKTAARYGRDCLDNLEEREDRNYFGRLLPLYLLCANFQMGAYAESINAGRYWEKHMGWAPPWLTVTPQTMWKVYDRTERKLPRFLKSWKDWRRGQIGSWSKRHKEGRFWHNDFYLEEKWKDKVKILNLWSFTTVLKYPNENERALLRTIKEMHWRSVQVKEMIPMLRMYASLHRVIPGQEKNTSRPMHMPAELLLGPFSPFSTSYNGRWVPYPEYSGILCYEYPGWWPFISRSWNASAEVPDGEVQTIQAWSGEILEQLVFRSKSTTLKLPDISPQGHRGKKVTVGARCGFSLLYSAPRTCPSEATYGKYCKEVGDMAELRLFRADNTSTTWSGSRARKLKPGEPLGWEWGQYSSGSGLCGLYRLVLGVLNTQKRLKITFERLMASQNVTP